jgi:hypothetical protein
MGKTPRAASDRLAAVNDNAAAAERVEAVVVILARLLGRQMARDQFRRAEAAANDNGGSPESGEP